MIDDFRSLQIGLDISVFDHDLKKSEAKEQDK
jgi:hypothetical protein